MIIFQKNNYTEKFLKKEKLTSEAFLESLEHRWAIVREHPAKIKVAGGYLYQNHKLYEFKVPHEKKDYRVAFFYQENQEPEVVFASKVTIKKDFLRSLSKTNLIHL